MTFDQRPGFCTVCRKDTCDCPYCPTEKRRGSVERPCDGCGTTIRVFLSRAGLGQGRFCSVRCRRAHQTSPEQVAARFWEKVDQAGGSDACWPWMAGLFRDGYGQFRLPPSLGNFKLKAHRKAYELTKGEIPAGLVVMHSCDNPPCCNPAHLSVGTVGDNTRDASAKGRLAAQRPGYRSTSTLTAENVAEMRALHAAGGWRFTPLGQRFGVSREVARMVVRRRTWKDV